MPKIDVARSCHRSFVLVQSSVDPVPNEVIDKLCNPREFSSPALSQLLPKSRLVCRNDLIK